MPVTKPPSFPAGAGSVDSSGKTVYPNLALRNWLIAVKDYFDQKIDTVTSATNGHVVVFDSDGSIKTSSKAPPAGQFVGDSDEQTLSAKTLSQDTVLTKFYTSAEKKKTASAQDPDDDFPDDTIVMTEATQTLRRKDVRHFYVDHDYDGAAVDWELTTGEARHVWLRVTNASGPVNIIAPLEEGKPYTVRNGCGFAVTIKVSGGAGVTIANGCSADVLCTDTDIQRRTPDATF